MPHLKYSLLKKIQINEFTILFIQFFCFCHFFYILKYYLISKFVSFINIQFIRLLRHDAKTFIRFMLIFKLIKLLIF